MKNLYRSIKIKAILQDIKAKEKWSISKTRKYQHENKCNNLGTIKLKIHTHLYLPGWHQKGKKKIVGHHQIGKDAVGNVN